MSTKKYALLIIVGFVIAFGVIYGPSVFSRNKLQFAEIQIDPHETSPGEIGILYITINNTGSTHIKNVSLVFETVPGVDIRSGGQLLNLSESDGAIEYQRDLGPLEINGQKKVIYAVTGSLRPDELGRLYSITINVLAGDDEKDTETVEFMVTP